MKNFVLTQSLLEFYDDNLYESNALTVNLQSGVSINVILPRGLVQMQLNIRFQHHGVKKQPVSLSRQAPIYSYIVYSACPHSGFE